MNVIASTNPLYSDLHNVLDDTFIYLDNPEELNVHNLRKINPKYIFFPHWSYIVPEEIYRNFECVIFHMTDLPFGRGGSPLQNLIVRGIFDTQISALKCQSGVDTGPIYLKRPLSLYGSAEEIMLRAKSVIKEMIRDIVKNAPNPVEQQGEITHFLRRKPEQGDIRELMEIESVFDYIRMLDADGYPKAFLETKFLRLEFERGSLKNGYLIADVKITKKETINE